MTNQGFHLVGMSNPRLATRVSLTDCNPVHRRNYNCTHNLQLLTS